MTFHFTPIPIIITWRFCSGRAWFIGRIVSWTICRLQRWLWGWVSIAIVSEQIISIVAISNVVIRPIWQILICFTEHVSLKMINFMTLDEVPPSLTILFTFFFSGRNETTSNIHMHVMSFYVSTFLRFENMTFVLSNKHPLLSFGKGTHILIF